MSLKNNHKNKIKKPLARTRGTHADRQGKSTSCPFWGVVLKRTLGKDVNVKKEKTVLQQFNSQFSAHCASLRARFARVNFAQYPRRCNARNNGHDRQLTLHIVINTCAPDNVCILIQVFRNELTDAINFIECHIWSACDVKQRTRRAFVA